MMILAMDPSGSFRYGSGTTGYTFIDYDTKEIFVGHQIKAKDFKKYLGLGNTKYQDEHALTILYANKLAKDKNKKLVVVLEDYIQSAATPKYQALETSELIGRLTMVMTDNNIMFVRQRSQLIKTNLAKEQALILLSNNQLSTEKDKLNRTRWYLHGKQINNHILDAIRHGLYYIESTKQKEKKQL